MDPTPPPPPASGYPAPKSGGGKKWVLFGCGGCLALIVLGAIAVGGLVFFVFGAIKKSDVYADALKRAQSSPQVQTALGTPIEDGMWVSGSVNTTNDSGHAELTSPLSGPKAQGALVLKADKAAGGPWTYSVLEVQVTGGEKINLLEPK
jgi:hypothetical protein